MAFLSATEALSFFHVFPPLRISQSGCAEFHGLIILVPKVPDAVSELGPLLPQENRFTGK
jgi:hypothetical protein